jgi:phosphate-selective porin OprO/OprP
MNGLFKKTALALAAASICAAGTASGDEASTKGGIKVKSDDGQFVGEFGGRLHVDAYAFSDDGDIENESGTDFRRLRLQGKATMYGQYEGFIQIDFGTGRSSGTGSSTTVKDAYLAYSGLGPGKLYVGQVKVPMGLEELTSSNYITFIERSSAINAVAPTHKRGVAYHGSTGNMTYAGMLYGQGVKNSGAVDNEGFGAGGRLTWTPIKDKTKVLHLGASAANEFNVEGFGDVSTRYEANLADSQTVLDFPATLTDAEDLTRYGLEGAFVSGPLSLQAEYLNAQADSVTGGDPEVGGFYVMGSYFLTGETRPYKASAGVFDRVKPNGKGGAWEVALRYSELEGESDVVSVGLGEANNTTLGLNWYANPQVRFMLNLMKADIDVLSAGGTRTRGEPETIALRAQFDF